MEYAVHTTVPHLLWLILVLANFIVQMACFNVPGRRLFIAKKVTTPLLLFGGIAVILLTSDGLPLVPGLLLAAMGLGELGIEGSAVVESRDGEEAAATPWTVTAAGVLFLLVNIFLGAVLFVRAAGSSAGPILLTAGVAAGVAAVTALNLILRRLYRPASTLRVQIGAYSGGLAVLAAGAAASLVAALPPAAGTAGAVPERLVLAGVVLTVSDSMVLWRMAAGWNSELPADRRKLLVFLVVILLLYYFYMGLLISMGSPFAAAGA